MAHRPGRAMITTVTARVTGGRRQRGRMGQRTEKTLGVTDMGRLKQIGMVMSCGANAVIDANGIPRGMVRTLRYLFLACPRSSKGAVVP